MACLKLEVASKSDVLKDLGTVATSKQSSTILQERIEVVRATSVVKVLCLFVVDKTVAATSSVVTELDITEGISSNEYVVVIIIVPDGGWETSFNTLRIKRSTIGGEVGESIA